jgi:hypothetical protein
VNELLPDLSPWAFTPSLAFAAKMVTVNMIVFWASVFFVFWLSRFDHQPAWERQVSRRLHKPTLVQALSREESV